MTNRPDDRRALAVPARRLERLGQLGSMTAGVVTNMALDGAKQLGRGQLPSMRELLLTPSNVKRISDKLAEMRGAAMKVGQLMSMDADDIMPPELTQILARLRDDAHFMPPAQLKAVLNTHWPENWLRSFTAFDVRPIAAASIGQVHRAQLKDGRQLAVKVQYPGVAKSIDSDVANIGVLIRMSGLLPKGFELAPYLEEGRKQLHEETDYAREAAQLSRFRILLADTPQFVVPELHSDWCTPNILAMTHLSGIPIEDAAREPQEVRDKIATDLIDLMLRELFVFGVMQTDPNFANYRYQPEANRIVLLDFGATCDIDPVIAEQYRKLMRAGLVGDVETIAQTATHMGFIGPDTPESHRRQLVRIICLLFDALQGERTVDFADKRLTRQLQAEGMALADDGFAPPALPIDVLLLQRKFGGIFLLAARLAAQVDVVGILERHLEQTGVTPDASG